MSEEGSAIVVGGGFGGLSCACFLADVGLDVTVLEKNEQLGGRAAVLERDGFRFDMGPSWYLMPDVFERFFSQFDRSPTDYYDLERLDPRYRLFFKDGDRIDVTDDFAAMQATFEEYETGAGQALASYLQTASEHYEVAMEEFVYTERGRWRDWLDPSILAAAPVGIRLLGTMDRYVSKYFEEPKLQQILLHSLVFLGGAPRNTPALYSMMAHVDFGMGVYYPTDGIGGVVDGIATLAEELGVTFETDAPVQAIRRNGNRLSVATPTETHVAPIVVSNADYAHTELELLSAADRQYDESYWDSRTLAPSALLIYLGVKGDVEPLAHHTLVLPEDWDPHFDRIFESPGWPENPAYYVCAPSVTDPDIAPDGHGNLFVLVPLAPGLDPDQATLDHWRDEILADLADNTGVDVRDRIVLEERFSVQDFAERYHSYRGTALGLAHTLKQTAIMRPDRRSSACPGLYYTGSYTTPGIGMPMCLISGEHTAKAAIADIA